MADESVFGAIEVRGARENNLRDVSVDIPKRQLTVVTGVSGSGKSSLVFDTVAAESQRLINETYSAFVQNFLPHYGRPDVDSVSNLSAAIVVDQGRMGANARSTVGTATDAAALLRILYSRAGEPRVFPASALSFNDPERHVPGVRGPGPVGAVGRRRAVRQGRRASTRTRSASPATGRAPGPGRSIAESGFFDVHKALARLHRRRVAAAAVRRRGQAQLREDEPDLPGPAAADDQVVPHQGARRSSSRTSAPRSSGRRPPVRARPAAAPAWPRGRGTAASTAPRSPTARPCRSTTCWPSSGGLDLPR